MPPSLQRRLKVSKATFLLCGGCGFLILGLYHLRGSSLKPPRIFSNSPVGDWLHCCLCIFYGISYIQEHRLLIAQQTGPDLIGTPVRKSLAANEKNKLINNQSKLYVSTEPGKLVYFLGKREGHQDGRNFFAPLGPRFSGQNQRTHAWQGGRSTHAQESRYDELRSLPPLPAPSFGSVPVPFKDCPYCVPNLQQAQRPNKVKFAGNEEPQDKHKILNTVKTDLNTSVHGVEARDTDSGEREHYCMLLDSPQKRESKSDETAKVQDLPEGQVSSSQDINDRLKKSSEDNAAGDDGQVTWPTSLCDFVATNVLAREPPHQQLRAVWQPDDGDDEGEAEASDPEDPISHWGYWLSPETVQAPDHSAHLNTFQPLGRPPLDQLSEAPVATSPTVANESSDGHGNHQNPDIIPKQGQDDDGEDTVTENRLGQFSPETDERNDLAIPVTQSFEAAETNLDAVVDSHSGEVTNPNPSHEPHPPHPLQPDNEHPTSVPCQNLSTNPMPTQRPLPGWEYLLPGPRLSEIPMDKFILDNPFEEAMQVWPTLSKGASYSDQKDDGAEQRTEEHRKHQHVTPKETLDSPYKMGSRPLTISRFNDVFRFRADAVHTQNGSEDPENRKGKGKVSAKRPAESDANAAEQEQPGREKRLKVEEWGDAKDQGAEGAEIG